MSTPDTVKSAPQTPANDLIGKSVAGYQSWFKCGGPDGEWHHWSRGPAAPGNVSFEVFPDMAEYPDDVTVEVELGNLNGRPGRLFRSRTQPVIDTHFKWMKEYGIGGAAVQRFCGDAFAKTPEGVLKDDVSHLKLIRAAAEKYERIFYIMYDVSGGKGHGAELLPELQHDIVHNLEGQGIVDSPAYAHADGKPVICVWGLAGGPNSRFPAAEALVPLFTWLKERGYFVVGGIPDNNWRADTSDYAGVYALLDMVSPWTVGRYGPDSMEGWQAANVPGDMAWCAAHGAVYQPVLFPGFAWSNWNGNIPNHIPRRSGKFLWDQARVYAAAGIKNAYFAMFDEYDEGTAIMKAARDSFDVPDGPQFFQTLCADGDWLSSGFYLRLAGHICEDLSSGAVMSEAVPVPYSEGPILWRNGFERRTAYIRLWRRTPGYPVPTNVDICTRGPGVLEHDRASVMVAEVVDDPELAHTGRCAFAFSGQCAEDGHMVYKLADADFKINKPVRLSYWLNPGNEGGQGVTMDLLFDDNTRLSQLVPDILAPCGTVGEWGEVSYEAPEAAGRTVKALLLTTTGGGFSALVDDMIVEEI